MSVSAHYSLLGLSSSSTLEMINGTVIEMLWNEVRVISELDTSHDAGFLWSLASANSL